VCYSVCPAAAGGRFRGSIGRALFRTTGVYQSVLEPDIATNKVQPHHSCHAVLSGQGGCSAAIGACNNLLVMFGRQRRHMARQAVIHCIDGAAQHKQHLKSERWLYKCSVNKPFAVLRCCRCPSSCLGCCLVPLASGAGCCLSLPASPMGQAQRGSGTLCVCCLSPLC
jgi:hypothetical protein